MATSEERQARALEAILAQLTFINGFLRKLVEVKDLPERTIPFETMGDMIQKNMITVDRMVAQKDGTFTFVGVMRTLDSESQVIGTVRDRQ